MFQNISVQETLVQLHCTHTNNKINNIEGLNSSYGSKMRTFHPEFQIKYRLNKEIAIKWISSNSPRIKFLGHQLQKQQFKFVKSISDFWTNFFSFQNRPNSIKNRLHIQRLITEKVKNYHQKLIVPRISSFFFVYLELFRSRFDQKSNISRTF